MNEYNVKKFIIFSVYKRDIHVCLQMGYKAILLLLYANRWGIWQSCCPCMLTDGVFGNPVIVVC